MKYFIFRQLKNHFEYKFRKLFGDIDYEIKTSFKDQDQISFDKSMDDDWTLDTRKSVLTNAVISRTSAPMVIPSSPS
ncbi:hypothetical protein RIR_jg41166.t1 [Rhizophagus irregularis DAOM 181602=DAOM 197198]|nr:hypothetical protein RIR_jg41166.t1 [Rhizophagus irregularis DAOM 181602=DAOM 197198]